MAPKQLYFAYGSNLNEQDLREWCDRHPGHEYPLAADRGTAFLPDHGVVFNWKSISRKGGVLNLCARSGHAVPGRVYEIGPGGWEALKSKENEPLSYEKKTVTVLTASGTEVDAVTYVVPEHRLTNAFVVPAPDYTRVVKDGLLRYELPTSGLETAAAGRQPTSLVASLFVYGTLLEGESRHHLLATGCNLAGVEHGQAPGQLFDLGDYPAMTTGSDGTVEGELLPLSNAETVLKVLDDVEGFQGFGVTSSLFRRSIVSVRTGDGRQVLAWTYVFNGSPDGPIIESGSWRERPRAGSCGSSRGGN